MTARSRYQSQPQRIYKFGQFIERAVYFVVILGIAVLFSTYLLQIQLPNRDFLFILSGAVAIYTLLYHQFVYFKNPTTTVAFIDSLVYATFIFLLNHMTGGLESPLFFLYLLPIVSVRLNLGSRLPLGITLYIVALIFLELILQVSTNARDFVTLANSLQNTTTYLAATDMVAILLVGWYIHSISIEFTHEHEQLREIERLNDELRRIDRGKDEFISIASHEIRTPLTALRGGLSLLLSNGVGKITSSQKDFVEKLLSAANRLSAVSEDSLNISALEEHRLSLKIEPFDLPKLIEHAISIFQAQAKEKKIKIILDKSPSTLPLALGDAKRIETVLNNLIDNAIKFTPSGGTVTVKVSSSGSKLVTSVSDTGVGIPEEELQNLFRKFYRVESVMNETSQGTGLGLYIVRLIMNLHGETVGVESELGKGSTFTFTLKAVPH